MYAYEGGFKEFSSLSDSSIPPRRWHIFFNLIAARINLRFDLLGVESEPIVVKN